MIVVQNNEIVASALTGYKLFRAISLAIGPKSALPTADWRVRNVDIRFTSKQNKACCCKSNRHHNSYIRRPFLEMPKGQDIPLATSLWQNIPKAEYRLTCSTDKLDTGNVVIKNCYIHRILQGGVIMFYLPLVWGSWKLCLFLHISKRRLEDDNKTPPLWNLIPALTPWNQNKERGNEAIQWCFLSSLANADGQNNDNNGYPDNNNSWQWASAFSMPGTVLQYLIQPHKVGWIIWEVTHGMA